MSQTQIPAHAAVPAVWQCEQCAGRGVNCGACHGKGSITKFVPIESLIDLIREGLLARALDRAVDEATEATQ